jgi:hypothetical protein
MGIRIVRVVLAVLASGVIVIATLGFALGVQLLALDDPEGSAHDVGLIVVPGALTVGLFGLGLFALAIRR